MPGSKVLSDLAGHLLTAKQVARILSISIRSLRRMIADGRLLSARLGRSVRIRAEALQALVEGYEPEGPIAARLRTRRRNEAPGFSRSVTGPLISPFESNLRFNLLILLVSPSGFEPETY